jgi:tetratricopeptide (TPR) repeat protein
MGDNKSALQNFQKAVDLESQYPATYYNYGLLLQQEGRVSDAEKVLLKGYSIFPQATNINYALAFLYLNQNQKGKAMPHVQILKSLDPGNPQYQSFFREFGLI